MCKLVEINHIIYIIEKQQILETLMKKFRGIQGIC
jgi:hypothetical protein